MSETIPIAGRTIGKGCEPFIVAEAGINHNGDIERAISMVHAAKEAGCDAVKFATLKAAEFSNPEDVITYRSKGELITEPEIGIVRRCAVPDDAWPVIKAECDRARLIFFTRPNNETALELLLRVGLPSIAVGSDVLTTRALFQAYA